MDFNRLDAYVNKKFRLKSEFIAASGISAAAYYKILKNQNCEVGTLEQLSRALDVSPAYWWTEENQNVMNEAKPNYGYVSKKVYDELMEKWTEDRQRMTRQIDFLQKMLEDKKGK